MDHHHWCIFIQYTVTFLKIFYSSNSKTNSICAVVFILSIHCHHKWCCTKDKYILLYSQSVFFVYFVALGTSTLALHCTNTWSGRLVLLSLQEIHEVKAGKCVKNPICWSSVQFLEEIVMIIREYFLSCEAGFIYIHLKRNGCRICWISRPRHTYYHTMNNYRYLNFFII